MFETFKIDSTWNGKNKKLLLFTPGLECQFLFIYSMNIIVWCWWQWSHGHDLNLWLVNGDQVKLWSFTADKHFLIGGNLVISIANEFSNIIIPHEVVSKHSWKCWFILKKLIMFNCLKLLPTLPASIYHLSSQLLYN